MHFSIETVKTGTMDQNCYLVVNPETNELFLIDPGAEPEKIIAAVGERTPKAVLLTHGHFDHIGAADQVCKAFGIPLYIHQQDAEKLTDPYKNESGGTEWETTVFTKPELLTDGQTLPLCGGEVTVMHTPGHTVGGVCYLAGDEAIFTGDTLFLGGYGRTDFWDGNFYDLKQSLRKILYLEGKRTAYPGHGAPTVAGR